MNDGEWKRSAQELRMARELDASLKKYTHFTFLPTVPPKTEPDNPGENFLARGYIRINGEKYAMPIQVTEEMLRYSRVNPAEVIVRGFVDKVMRLLMEDE